MSKCERGQQVVMRRKISQVDGSRPDSCHKGNLKRLKTSSVGEFQRWEKENELLWAMLEDETEWLGKLFPDIIITPDLFFYALEDGVVLCRLANLIQETAQEFGEKNHAPVSGKTFKFHRTINKKSKQLALFKSRENVQGFLTWCRQLGISDSILFESNDIVEADECREGCREVVICLMEIARRAAGRFKFTPIPKLIQLEKEIEAEEQEEAKLNHIDYGSTTDEESSNDSGHSPEHTSPNSNGRKKNRKKLQLPKSELDKEVFKIIDSYNVYNIRKIKEGKYLILGKIMFVRMLNGHVLLRIGGGWDTLEHYLLTHIPKDVSENGHSHSDVKPSVSKTPQKLQLAKLLDKVKKATPVSSPYRGPAATTKTPKKDEPSKDDEKDITSAIRKIEFSVNKNIATRRKNSRVVEVTPEKTSFDVNQTYLNQNNNIVHSDPARHLKQTQEDITCSENHQSTRKMEDETSRAESGFFEETSPNGDEAIFGEVEDNGGGHLMAFDGTYENGICATIEDVKTTEERSEETADVVDGIIIPIETTPAMLFPDAQESEIILNEDAPLEEVKSIDIVSSPDNGKLEGENPCINSDITEFDHSPAVEPPTDIPDAMPNSTDHVLLDHVPINDDTNVAVTSSPINVTSDSEKPTAVVDEAAGIAVVIPNGDVSPAPIPAEPAPAETAPAAPIPADKNDADLPKKKAPKNGKEPLKTKPGSRGTVTKSGVASKKSVPVSTTTRPRTSPTKPSRPTSAAVKSTTRTTTTAVKSPTKSTTTTTVKSPTKSTVSDKTGKTSPTTSPRKPATRPVTAPTSRTTRPARTAPTTAAKKPAEPSKKPEDAAKKPGEITRKPRETTRKPGETTKKPGETTKKPGEATKKPGETTKKPGETTKKPGETTKKPGETTKKLGETTRKVAARPATAPPARSTQVKGRPVASKVQSGLGSARPQTAKTRPLTTTHKDATDGGVASKGIDKTPKDLEARAPSPTKPLVRKTHTKTVTTLKTTRKNANGDPESQTLKTTKTVTEANGKTTTKTTVKEVSPTGRKPLKMTTTETTEANGAPGKKTTGTAARQRPERPGSKRPEVKSKVGSSRVGASKTTGGVGPKKNATKPGEKSTGKVSSHLKGTMPKPKTVKELSNALGITKPGAVTEVKSSEKKPSEDKPVEQVEEKSYEEADTKPDEQVRAKPDEQAETKPDELAEEEPVEKPIELLVETLEYRPVEQTEDRLVELSEEKLVEHEQIEDKTIEQDEEILIEPLECRLVEQTEERLVEKDEEKTAEHSEEQEGEVDANIPSEQFEYKLSETNKNKLFEGKPDEEEVKEERQDEQIDERLRDENKMSEKKPDEDVKEERQDEEIDERLGEPDDDKLSEEKVDEEVEERASDEFEDRLHGTDQDKPVKTPEKELVEQVLKVSAEQVEQEEEQVEQAASESDKDKLVETISEKLAEQTEEIPAETGEEPVEQVHDTEEKVEGPGDELAEAVPGEEAEDGPGEQSDEKPGEPVSSEENLVVNYSLIETIEVKEDYQEARETFDGEGLGPDSHVTTSVVSESHAIVESSEMFPERGSPIDGDDNFEDSFDDVIRIPPGDVIREITKVESTEAWPAVDNESAQFSSEETGTEVDVEYQGSRFPVDPHAYQPFPSVFLASTLSPEKGFEFSTSDNNNLVEDMASNEEMVITNDQTSLSEIQEFKPNFQEDDHVTTVDDLLG